MRVRSVAFLAVMLMAGGVTTPANAQSQTDEWRFQVAPLYLWAVSIDGTMTVKGRFEQDFGVDFSDAFDNLDGAFTLHFEAGKGRWGVLADITTMSLSGSNDINTPGGAANLEIENLILEGAGGYSFAEDWWVIAGVRYFDLDADIGFELDMAPEIELGDSWTDAFAGVMWRPKLGERWTFSARADIGAGGSDLVWNAAALIDFAFAKWASAFAGYRHLDYDYASDSADLEFDASLSGPVIALRFFW